MARPDSVGFFWDDTPPPKPPKAEKQKRTPPEPVWLAPDYLPGLKEAVAFPVRVLSLSEMVEAASRGDEFLVDVECYPNYFLVMFTSVKSGAVFWCEEIDGVSVLDRHLLHWLLTSLTTIGFNSNSYDLTMCAIACAGFGTLQLQVASNRIIVDDIRGGDVLREFKVKKLECDHIDLIEVAPLFASLKTYAGRLHVPKMQDLPFAPGTILTPDQITITRWYCVNDTTNTEALRSCLSEHIDLRYKLSNEYKLDLRSKSDAQIAESVLAEEIKKFTGKRPQRPKIEPGTMYRYQVPHFLQYRTPLLNWALRTIREAQFIVDFNGNIGMPEEIKELTLRINQSIYRMGIGGLHSSEQTISHVTDEDNELIDKDVTSYYPYIILNLGLAPKHLGQVFLNVYRGIVERRIEAKRAKQDIIAQSLKIVINGSFGKLGSKWSILYSPDLLIQVTITGQLSLLMLIERLELAGIPVVSANTDGMVIKCPRTMKEVMNSIVGQWEIDTGFATEETRYLALFSRDVNNYIAIKQKQDKETGEWLMEPDGTKTKGAYNNPWASAKNPENKLHKNPTATICVEAVEKYLTEGIPVATTIRECSDIAKFVSVRTVRGGAVKVWEDIPPPSHKTERELLALAGFSEVYEDAWILKGETGRDARYGKDAYKEAVKMLSKPGPTEYIGKTVRWYYAKGVEGVLVYARSGNNVPRSAGARPLMVLPEILPNDIDYEWYTDEAHRILTDIAAPL